MVNHEKKKHFFLIVLFLASCQEVEKKEEVADALHGEVKSVKKVREQLTSKGFEIFDYVDEETKDTVLMQQYFFAFLKRGPNQSQVKEEVDSLQALPMAHLGRMYDEGYADSLANSDPMVKAGRLVIEIHPWWAAKRFPLR